MGAGILAVRDEDDAEELKKAGERERDNCSWEGSALMVASAVPGGDSGVPGGFHLFPGDQAVLPALLWCPYFGRDR